jgi:hypothetical protein
MGSARDYSRSNRYRSFPVSVKDPRLLASLRLLLSASTAPERQEAGAALLASLCAQAGVAAPLLLVLDTPRPHRVKDGRLAYQKLGVYSPRTKTIRLHNRTARLGRTVAPRTFLETLVHELTHHWDFELLKLGRSLHTSGFYHRLGSVKRQLLAAVEA